MSPEEFKKTFKVGDFVTCKEWEDEGDYSEQITAIGEHKFLSSDSDLVENTWLIENIYYWKKVDPPKEKDLKDLIPALYIKKQEGKIWCINFDFVSKEYFENFKSTDKNIIELITLQEGKERGLDLSFLNV